VMSNPSEQFEERGPSTAEVRALRLFDGLRDQGTFILGPQGHIETWSYGAEEVTGYSADDAIGKHVSLLYPSEEIVSGEPNHELARAEQLQQIQGEVRRQRKDGSRFTGQQVVTVMRSRLGDVRGFVVVLRDLTERRRTVEALRLSNERFRFLVESVKDYAIFMLDPTGHVMTWNEGAERIKGYRADEIIGEHLSRFYSDAEAHSGKADRELAIAATEGRFEEEGWRVRKDGTQFWASVVLTPLRDPAGRLIGFAKVTRDLTQQRRLDEERLRRAQAEESIRLRDEFLSIASHELKTPLTALQLQLQNLQKKISHLDDGLAPRITRAVRSGQRLADLIEALLDVSRIATGRFELHRDCIDLGLTARDVVERLQDAALKEGCEVSVEAESELIGSWDRLRVEQVLINLLANAIKYGAGSPVSVIVRADGHDAEMVVTDRGPGIPEKDLHRIFGRFERASSMRNYGGLGLGLYVARQIVEAHGGSVSARNLPEGGARFLVRLPRLACPPGSTVKI
jgi:PAS domain S-box-containing protein